MNTDPVDHFANEIDYLGTVDQGRSVVLLTP